MPAIHLYRSIDGSRPPKHPSSVYVGERTTMDQASSVLTAYSNRSAPHQALARATRFSRSRERSFQLSASPEAQTPQRATRLERTRVGSFVLRSMTCSCGTAGAKRMDRAWPCRLGTGTNCNRTLCFGGHHQTQKQTFTRGVCSALSATRCCLRDRYRLAQPALSPSPPHYASRPTHRPQNGVQGAC